ncbi:MAG: hypothetical protein K0R05_797 [Anaerocolumna sp.]|nr:hypothetical protein [Anaerocolumna sp.]
MKEYKLSENHIKLKKRKSVLLALPIILIAILSGLIVGSYENGFQELIIVLPMVLILIVIAVIIGLKFGNRINNDTLTSYRIELYENKIIKYQKNIPTIEIEQIEVISITEYTNKGIMINSENKAKNIFVPVFTEEYSEIKESLSVWMNIKEGKNKNEQLLRNIAGFGTAIGFMVVMLCENPYIVIPVSIIMIAVLIWSIVTIFRNSHIDRRIKKNTLFVIVPILVILARTLSITFLEW